MKKKNNWVKVANCVSRDPSAIVKCPECNDGYLHKIIIPLHDFEKVDIHIYCPKCHARNVITKKGSICTFD
ncbi:MAG TPA: hypothetical protein ENJ95_21215 [Bacteroidetes bacterium]|nr:hypothetical protein [Bacteroidota bacterium]